MIVKNALSGLVLVIGILYLFLSGRVGFWVMLGIPVSFMLGLAFFHLGFGYGISIIALIGFIMAIGIVVDDAIVVGEDTVTHFEQGKSPMDAAVAGARRMWVPVLTSSLTTLAAFLPLLIMGGEMGDAVLALPTVLLCVILASLVECFLVLPGHLAGTLNQFKRPAADSWRARFDRAFFGFRDNRFLPFVRRALDYPGATVCAAIGGVMVALSLLVSQHVGFAFVTGFDIESLQADVEFSSAASDADKLDFLNHLETELQAVHEANDSANLLGWVTKYNLASFSDERMTGEQYASIEANYRYEESRTIQPSQFVEQWRARIVKPVFVEQLTVQVDGGQNNGEPDLTLVLRGDDLDALKRGAEELAEALARYPGCRMSWTICPTAEIRSSSRSLPWAGPWACLQTASAGSCAPPTAVARVQIFNDNDSELEVRMMLPDVERDDLARLQQFPVRTPEGTFVPLASVAVLYNRRGIDVIRHTDGQMAVSVSADVDPQHANAIAITSDLRSTALPEILDRYNLSFGLGGKSEQDEVIMNTMALGGVLTLLLIYLILVLGIRLLPVAAGHHDGDSVRFYRRRARPLGHGLGRRRHDAAGFLRPHRDRRQRFDRADQLLQARSRKRCHRAGGPRARCARPLPRRAADLTHHHSGPAAAHVRNLVAGVLRSADRRDPVLWPRLCHAAGAHRDTRAHRPARICQRQASRCLRRTATTGARDTRRQR